MIECYKYLELEGYWNLELIGDHQDHLEIGGDQQQYKGVKILQEFLLVYSRVLQFSGCCHRNELIHFVILSGREREPTGYSQGWVCHGSVEEQVTGDLGRLVRGSYGIVGWMHDNEAANKKVSSITYVVSCYVIILLQCMYHIHRFLHLARLRHCLPLIYRQM